MATDLVVNAMLDLQAQYAIGAASPTTLNLYLHLFVNNHTLAVGDTVSSLTECTAPGYAAVNLTHSSWSGSTSAGVADYTYPQILFTMTGPGSPGQTIYGHYYTTGTGPGTLLWGQTYGTPFVIPSGGGIVAITPTWQDQNC